MSIDRSKAMATSKQKIKNLLSELANTSDTQKRANIRKRLRRLGHKGGLRTTPSKQKKRQYVKQHELVSKLTPKQQERVHKHNAEVTRRIEAGEYKPFG
jgi:hypothetical protein